MANKAHKVLYIEDQSDMIDLVRLTLRQMGCDVYGATDGIQGLSMMRDLQPDLVLLDLMLPGSDGWQVRNAMQADAQLKTLPVILVTARVQEGNPAGNRQLPQADAYITTPFSLTEMRTTVKSFLSEH